MISYSQAWKQNSFCSHHWQKDSTNLQNASRYSKLYCCPIWIQNDWFLDLAVNNCFYILKWCYSQTRTEVCGPHQRGSVSSSPMRQFFHWVYTDRLSGNPKMFWKVFIALEKDIQRDSVMRSVLCGGHAISSRTLFSPFHWRLFFKALAVCLGSLSRCWMYLGPLIMLHDVSACTFQLRGDYSFWPNPQLHVWKCNPNPARSIHNASLLPSAWNHSSGLQ